MSRENVEVIRRIYARWERERDIDPSEFHPEFELRTPIMELENRRHLGYEGYSAWRALNDEVFTDNWFDAAEFVDLGDRVLVTGWLRLTGKKSGIEAREPAVQLWTFKEDKPSSMTVARTVEDAETAAGLSE
jgi:ketosteroid isomerase-like protein